MNKVKELFERFPILYTKNYLLRALEKGDYKQIYEIYKDEDAVRYQGIRAAKSSDEGKKFIEYVNKGYENKQFLRWGICSVSDNTLIGICSLHHIDIFNSVGEVGYMLNKKYWRKNIMSEVMGEVIEFLFHEVKLNRLEASIHPENLASIRLCEKLGFMREGLKQKCAYNAATNYFEDRYIYAQLRSHYLITNEIKL